jgi:hypothetical protein
MSGEIIVLEHYARQVWSCFIHHVVGWNMLYIGFSPGACREKIPLRRTMTYLDVVYRYGAAPGEAELRALDGMREVYGIRGLHFNQGERTVRVGYDASRMKADGIARLLRQAGIDVKEQLILA